MWAVCCAQVWACDTGGAPGSAGRAVCSTRTGRHAAHFFCLDRLMSCCLELPCEVVQAELSAGELAWRGPRGSGCDRHELISMGGTLASCLCISLPEFAYALLP